MPCVNEALAAVVGAQHVVTEPDVRAGYERDWTGRWGGQAACVVRPGSVEEVRGVVRACREAGAGACPRGGGGRPRRARHLSRRAGTPAWWAAACRVAARSCCRWPG